MTLRWVHTELGRRTDDERFRVIRNGRGWQLLDTNWDPIGEPCATIPEAQQLAERLAARRTPPNRTQP